MNPETGNTISIELIVAILASATTVITVFLTNLFSSLNELRTERRNLKESKYIGFLKLIIDARGKFNSDNIPEINQELSETLQMIYLIGNDEVIDCTRGFIAIIKKPNAGLNQNKLYSDMIKAMRRDLYGKRRAYDHPKELELMIFQ